MTTTATRLVTADQIAWQYRVDHARIYLLAHRKKWARIKWQGRVYYRLADVDKALGADPDLRLTRL